MAKNSRHEKYKNADVYSKQAQKEGYPARSVYKLAQIFEKYHILKRVHAPRVLDIGAYPGSWSLYVARNFSRAYITSIDLKQIDETLFSAMHHITVLCGDIFSYDIQEVVKRNAPYDLIMSDAAPRTSGNRMCDTMQSAAIVEHIVYNNLSLLSSGGTCIAKIFQSDEARKLLGEFRQQFDKAYAYRPPATRSHSYEVFLVGIAYRGESKS